jgi:MYXO-CTERM domain-containing protein
MPPAAAKSASRLATDGRPAHSRWHSRVRGGACAPIAALALAAALACVAACAEPAPAELGEAQFGLDTVGDHVGSGCSTDVVLGLSRQIADEVACVAPGALVPFEEGAGITFTGSAVLPYLAPDAKQDLLDAAAAAGGTIEINSAFRTVAQQYLLYRWYQQGRCGITAAATPGNSNHETGRAVDVNNYGAWIGALGNQGWAHDVAGDPVHFDHLASPDLRGKDVLAFQRLWNRNHPDDPIAEDGDYGPQTAARLDQAPAAGFPLGADCGAPADHWDARHDDPALVASAAPGARVEVHVDLVNTGNTTWKPGEVFLGTTMPRDRASALFDSSDWLGPNRPTTVDAETAPGATGRFTFVVLAPATEATYTESFGLLREGVTWFGPEDVTLELDVAAGAGPGSGDPGVEPTDPDGSFHVAGGCAATGQGGGGGGGVWIVVGVALAAARRRRRA